MSNEIEIRVTSKDQTAAGFASADARVKALESSSSTSLGRMKEKFTRTGEDSGRGFGAGVLKEGSRGAEKLTEKLGSEGAKGGEKLARGIEKESGSVLGSLSAKFATMG